MSTDETRDIVLEASLALSAVAPAATERGLGKPVNVLADLLELLTVARCMKATGPHGLVCTLCQGSIDGDDGDTEPNLLKQIYLMQTHTCRKSEEPTSVDRARTALDAACEALVDECHNSTPVWTVVDATLRLVHEVVKEERDKVSKTYENTAALDRVVELTEPGRLRRG